LPDWQLFKPKLADLASFEVDGAPGTHSALVIAYFAPGKGNLEFNE
jgi:hypothetical protein